MNGSPNRGVNCQQIEHFGGTVVAGCDVKWAEAHLSDLEEGVLQAAVFSVSSARCRTLQSAVLALRGVEL